MDSDHDRDGGSNAGVDPDVDEVDRQLIDALLADGRASASDLSEAVGVATATATKRLQRLEKSGVVEGYRPVVDYDAAGYDVTAVFKLDVHGDGLERVVDELRSTGRMIGVYEVTGDYDVVAVGKFAGTGELDGQIKELLTHEDVRATSTDVVLETVREYEQFPVANAE